MKRILRLNSRGQYRAMTGGTCERLYVQEEPAGGVRGGVRQDAFQQRRQPLIAPSRCSQGMVPQLPGEIFVVRADPAMEGEDTGRKEGMLSAASRRASVACWSRWFFSQREAALMKESRATADAWWDSVAGKFALAETSSPMRPAGRSFRTRARVKEYPFRPRSRHRVDAELLQRHGGDVRQ
ncbi:hypothetical protein [Planomonospora venezuelensis]|uniref:hypothetical protein n=1 Tax=Planomonospora venezuelensis TaxID=1999 RepID=UPI0031EB64FD